MASFLLMTLWTSTSFLIFGLYVLHAFSPSLPQIVSDFLLYGKVRGKRIKWNITHIFDVPKRWFVYFYILGAIINITVMYQVASTYLLGQAPHLVLVQAVNAVTDANSVSTGSMSALLVISMMAFQCTRRSLECMFLSVYSKSTMHLGHFSLGVLLYSTFHLAVLSEAPDISTYTVHDLGDELFKLRHMVGLGLFLWASWNHHEAHVGFANLRKNKQGGVRDLGHHIPHGGWFEYVSCPHYFFEELIYCAFIITTGFSHVTLWSIVSFVFLNQTVASMITHRWYRATFKTYPRDRKAVWPYLL